MIRRVKRIVPSSLKHLLKHPYGIVRRFVFRPVPLLLHSPSTLLKNVSSGVDIEDHAQNQAGRGPILRSESRLFEAAISYPIWRHRSGRIFGGIADPSGTTLIQTANLYRGDANVQHLTEEYATRYKDIECLDIDHPTVYGGMMFNHFGHFILESLCRLHAYESLRHINPLILFHLPDGIPPRYLERTNYAHQVLTGLGIPVDRIVFADRPLRLQSLHIPSQEYGYGFMHAPEDSFVEFIRRFQHRRRIPRGFGDSKRIYVSRSNLRRGRIVGEDRFERILEEQGYRIFHPEDYTMHEQLTVYSQAQQIIFAEGSALLGCILLPDLDAAVAVVARRREPGRSSRVTVDCLQGYGKPLLWIDAVKGQYPFGLDIFEALSDVDWNVVVQGLCDGGFLDRTTQVLSAEVHADTLRSEMIRYIEEVRDERRFVDHMTTLMESPEREDFVSDIIDPRNGQPVLPNV